jgi:homoserine dehydrogenase
LRNGLVGNKIQSVCGILNGTCNYILTRMADDQVGFDAALREAQAKGFAEADSTLDVGGHDAAQKLKILAELAFDAQIANDMVQVEGITEITADDVQAAEEFGYVIKHLAIAELRGGVVALRAAPVLLPRDHQLASVRNENNAVLLRGDAVGEMLFCGKGAGALPSASAVLSDVVDIACDREGFRPALKSNICAANQDYVSKHYLRFEVSDPSAIGPITTVLERSGVGVARAAAVWGKSAGAQHQVRVLSHPCPRTAVDLGLAQVGLSQIVSGRIALRIQ